jgi:capsular polysaccharide biosynthesis protein
MVPRRVERARFEELVVFRDPENADRARRADRLRARLVGPGPFDRHPGVFLLRGATGAKRTLTDERGVAERLAAERGFRVLDPSASSVEEIVAACAGARVVAGVEGSHLFHGLALMPPDAALFVIQPPRRVVSLTKRLADRRGQRFAFLVAEGGADEFAVRPEEVARTLDLLG